MFCVLGSLTSKIRNRVQLVSRPVSESIGAYHMSAWLRWVVPAVTTSNRLDASTVITGRFASSAPLRV
jgi:hypothetical protein